ncbi:MAG: polysaccharide deacetylase family protein [Pseudomonadota bacterium]
MVCRILGLVALAAFLFAAAPSSAACPGNPNALGTSRVLVADASAGLEIGTLQYADTLPLADGELVFTFDDGPNPTHTPAVLDALDAHCVKATFFLVGRYARHHPELVREIHRRGHTIANHTWSHPILSELSHTAALREIERGEAAINAALADIQEARAAPFFRFPGLNHTRALRRELAEAGVAVMSCDIGTDDWRGISADEIHRRALRNIEARGSGVIIMHDTNARTAQALPRLLDTLAERGYRVVHMAPAEP